MNANGKACTIGSEAHKSGLGQIPCLDPALMRLLEMDGIDCLSAIKAWTKGWHASCDADLRARGII